jgi:hypothetical protein
VREVVDLSILIELRIRKRLRLLNGPISRGNIAVASYSLKRLRKSSAWRQWVDRHRVAIEERLLPGPEQQLFAELIGQLGKGTSGPLIADDDIMAIVIAKSRGWRLAMRDRAAVAVAKSLDVRVDGLEDFLQLLDGAAQGFLPGFDQPGLD